MNHIKLTFNASFISIRNNLTRPRKFRRIKAKKSSRVILNGAAVVVTFGSKFSGTGAG